MSQFDYGTIDAGSKSGTALASDLNSFRTALNSSHKGSSRPAYAIAGTLWVNDAVNPWTMYVFDGTDDIALGAFDIAANTFVPAGHGSSSAQTLTNKSIDLTDNTVTGTASEFNTAVTDDNFGFLGADQTWTKPQAGTITTDNDLSFDLNATNNFSCTPSAGGTLTFTNIASAVGQSGTILLVNGSNYAIAKAATTKCNTGFLATVSATGTYRVGYYCDGTNVYVATDGAAS